MQDLGFQDVGCRLWVFNRFRLKARYFGSGIKGLVFMISGY